MIRRNTNKIYRKIFSILCLSVIFFNLFPKVVLNAADFESQIDLIYSVVSDDVMHIKEVRATKNNSSEFYIKGETYETFLISTFKTRTDVSQADLQKVADTVKVTNTSGNVLSPSIEIKNNQIEVAVMFGSDLNRGEQKVIILEYDSYELVEKNGNVWNIYVPGMTHDFQKLTTSENGATTQTNFSVRLEFNKNLGEPNFVLPEPASSVEFDGKRIYVFEPSSLIDQTAWLQIGDKQYYYFEITQHVKSSLDLSSKVFYTFYDLALPRESDSENQQVFFRSIIPEPEYIRYDGEDNVIARFKFSNEEETEIKVTGYISTSIKQEITHEDVGDIDDIDLDMGYAEIDDEQLKYEDLLEPAIYWEVDAEAIKEKADELKEEKTNVYDIVLSDYTFITENVDYDNLKVGVSNQRNGALSTLNGGSSVCMEFADLLITLLRAQGIPARAAFGYGFDPRSEGETEEGHQWIEVYMPGVGWVPVDPTWGDTGRRNYIGSDVDHALWRVASVNVDIPSPVTKYSILDDSELQSPVFKIEVVESIDNVNLITLEDLISKYEYSPKAKVLERFEQLNDYGKVIFIGIPGILVLIVIFFFFMSLIKFLKRIMIKKG